MLLCYWHLERSELQIIMNFQHPKFSQYEQAAQTIIDKTKAILEPQGPDRIATIFEP